jgi:ferredoxin-NADP reductase
VNVGDVLEASAPRATFTLEPDARPLVLASAGIGITPVLAILHVLAAERSMREIWWLYGPAIASTIRLRSSRAGSISEANPLESRMPGLLRRDLPIAPLPATL